MLFQAHRIPSQKTCDPSPYARNHLAMPSSKPSTERSVLSRLSKDGVSTATALAAAERVRPQSMASIIAALDDRGLIERRSDPDDRRRTLLGLSPDGTNWLGDARRVRSAWLARALAAQCTEAQRRQLIDAVMTTLED